MKFAGGQTQWRQGKDTVSAGEVFAHDNRELCNGPDRILKTIITCN